MLGLISINYKTTPLEIREKFFLSDSDQCYLYTKYRKDKIVDGLYIISTCNRTEIYFEVFDLNLSFEYVYHKMISKLVKYKKFSESISPYITVKNSKDVVSHIFSLASGLESMLIGEYQIVDQIKKSYSLAVDNKSLSPILNRLIQKSLNASKVVRTKTKIDKGAVSVSYAAVERISSLHKNKSVSILNIGTGETGKLTLDYLIKKKFKNITILNRTLKNSINLSEKLDINYDKFSNLIKLTKNADILIFSTSSTGKLILKKDLIKIFKNRNKELLIVDLSVPTNVPEDVVNISNIKLVNVDDLKEEVNKNYKKRKDEIDIACKIISKLTDDFDDWMASKKMIELITNVKSTINKKIKINNNCKCCENIFDEHFNLIVKNIKSLKFSDKNNETLKIINAIFLNNG